MLIYLEPFSIRLIFSLFTFVSGGAKSERIEIFAEWCVEVFGFVRLERMQKMGSTGI